MSLTSEQKKIFAGHKLQMTFHLNAESGNTLNSRCEELGLCRSVFTPKIYSSDAQRKAGYYDGFGTPEVVYGLDGLPDTFKTLAEVADAILLQREKGVLGETAPAREGVRKSRPLS